MELSKNWILKISVLTTVAFAALFGFAMPTAAVDVQAETNLVSPTADELTENDIYEDFLTLEKWLVKTS